MSKIETKVIEGTFNKKPLFITYINEEKTWVLASLNKDLNQKAKYPIDKITLKKTELKLLNSLENK